MPPDGGAGALVHPPDALALLGGKGAASAQNLVTCVYRAKLAGACRLITVTWVKNAMGGQGLSVSVDDPDCQCACQVQMKKPWWFCRKHGGKSLEIGGGRVVEVLWDLSAARFVCGPEPVDGFYVAVIFGEEMVLLLGDKTKEAIKHSKLSKPSLAEFCLVSRKEHVFGRRQFTTKAQFEEGGKAHDIVIECQTDSVTKEPCLAVRIDRHSVLQIQRLAWKFRGNQTVSVNGTPLDIFWDVHNWLFQSPSSSAGHALFIFQTRLQELTGEVEKGGSEKRSRKKIQSMSGDLSAASKLANARSLPTSKNLEGLAASSLLLYAWKSD